VVDHIRTFDEKTVFIGVVYFNYRLRNHQSQRAVLEALTRQMYEACQGTVAASTMENMYESHRKYKSRPSGNELRQVLCTGCRQFRTCYVVLDALDEYTEQYTAQKISDLLKLILSLNGNVKVLATSRDLEGMVTLFKDLGASTEEVIAEEDDMKLYVENRVELTGFPFELPEESVQEIVREVVKSARDRYVYLYRLLNDF
jgi:hypothetical protein